MSGSDPGSIDRFVLFEGEVCGNGGFGGCQYPVAVVAAASSLRLIGSTSLVARPLLAHGYPYRDINGMRCSYSCTSSLFLSLLM